MSRSVKISLITIVLLALAILSFFAASDNFFFYTLNMTYDNAVEERNGGYELYFYTYGNKDTNNKFQVATVFYDVQYYSGNMAHITFQISPIYKFKVYSMNLDIKGFQPASALILEDPESGQSLPFVYIRSDSVLSATLDFPDLDLDYGEPITIDFWLDLLNIDLVTEDHLILGTFFSIHDKSAFKIVKYTSHSAMEIDIP